MNKPRVSAIAIIGKNRALGINNKLIWKIPEDLARLKKLTLNHPIIMGRKTFESIGRPLPFRTNIVITRNKTYSPSTSYSTPDNLIISHALSEALSYAKKIDPKEVFIFGGGEVYKLALSTVNRLYLTIVDDSPKADAFFPDYSDFTKIIFKKPRAYKNINYAFLTLERP
jgi:dihydrofolate reductase